eukprot:TRINITY_DN50700_c0_g1_i1.p1 TRINITY_DN50700_c0_g1~~TRINITY_DN50700_c0_g1_i1.p1  ORF type:complete len:244 (-),score=1.17 TRINITY_DN50700_c0_g1_i1:52-681(-)
MLLKKQQQWLERQYPIGRYVKVWCDGEAHDNECDESGFPRDFEIVTTRVVTAHSGHPSSSAARRYYRHVSSPYTPAPEDDEEEIHPVTRHQKFHSLPEQYVAPAAIAADSRAPVASRYLAHSAPHPVTLHHEHQDEVPQSGPVGSTGRPSSYRGDASRAGASRDGPFVVDRRMLRQPPPGASGFSGSYAGSAPGSGAGQAQSRRGATRR